MVSALVLVAVVVVVLAGTLFSGVQLFGPRSPSGAAKAAVHAIADGNAGALANQIDRTGQVSDAGKSRKDLARAAVAFFDGWKVDPGSIRELRQIDDNWYFFRFVATKQSTGRRVSIRANLVPQGETGEPPWKLGSLWIAGPGNHHNKSIL